MREGFKEQVKFGRSSSNLNGRGRSEDNSHRETRHSRNYSIVSPRETSSVNFFANSKIKDPRYLSREVLNDGEGRIEDQHYQKYLKPEHNGYIQFHKRRARHPNYNSKGFERVLCPYEH
jgi:hypothetical protein